MKKRILSLVAALALAATVVAPVNAEVKVDSKAAAQYSSTTKITASTAQKVLDAKVFDTKDLKPAGQTNLKVGVVTGNAKDNIKDAMKEAVTKMPENKVNSDTYFDLTGETTGKVTFKLTPGNSEFNGDTYAVVLHYTGNASDENGVTVQYAKIKSSGKIEANFNSFSPVGIIATNYERLQELVDAVDMGGAGSDGGTASNIVNNNGIQSIEQPTEVTTPATTGTTTDAAAGKTTEGKTAPKMGDDDTYALYLILAVAAVAGTTLVATKKTR